MSDHDAPLDHLLTTPITRPLPAIAAQPSREAVAAGIRVASTLAQQDRLDPHRPTLGQLVTDEVAAVERRIAGRRADDGDAAAIRQRIADVIEQRESLADARVKIARQRIDEGNLGSAASELTWAASLRDQAAALRTMLA